MGDFLAAQPYVMQNEGGYSIMDGDTYRGIARRFFPNLSLWATIDSYKPLKQGELIADANLDSLISQFYKTNFWNRIQGDLITEQSVATYLYDFFVNAGGNAVKCLQTVLGITVDGGFGNDTLAALNAAGDILPALHAARVAYYTKIGVGSNAKYVKGWTSRANDMYSKLAG